MVLRKMALLAVRWVAKLVASQFVTASNISGNYEKANNSKNSGLGATLLTNSKHPKYFKGAQV
jgi:hypothetical protein